MLRNFDIRVTLTSVLFGAMSSLYLMSHLASTHLLDYDGYQMYQQISSPVTKRNGLPNLTDLESIKPFLKFDNQLKPLHQGEKNGKIILQCRVSGSPPAIIFWQFHKDHKVSVEQRNRISRGGGYQQSEMVNFDDSSAVIGNSVESSYNLGDGSKTADYDPLSSTGYRYSVNSLRRRRQVLDPRADYKESLQEEADIDDQQPVPHQLGLSVTQSRLELDCLDEQDAGAYMCVAQNAVKIIEQSTVVRIKDSGKEKCETTTGIKTRPKFYLPQFSPNNPFDIIAANGKREKPKMTPARIYMWTKNRIENQGTNVRIFCRSSGTPKPLIAWLSPIGNTLHSDKKYQILKNGDLYIKNISWEHDMGLYICLVNNEYGSDHKEAFLYPLDSDAQKEE